MKTEKKIGLIISMLILSIFTVNVKAETYEYDKLNRVTKVIYEDGSYTIYEYDSNGNITNVDVHKAEPMATTKPTVNPSLEPTDNPEPSTTKEPGNTNVPIEDTSEPTIEPTVEPTEKPEDEESEKETIFEKIGEIVSDIVKSIKAIISKIIGWF